MQFKKEPGKIHLILDAGEEIISSLQALAVKENIPSASFTGIGGVTDIILGWFSVEQKEYISKTYIGNYELCSLMGSISWDENKPVAHAHAVISGADYISYGGHFTSWTISITGEIFLHVNESMLERHKNKQFPLKFIDFSNNQGE